MNLMKDGNAVPMSCLLKTNARLMKGQAFEMLLCIPRQFRRRWVRRLWILHILQ